MNNLNSTNSLEEKVLVHYDSSIIANILLKEVIREMGFSGNSLKNLRIDQKIIEKCKKLIDKRFKDESFRNELKRSLSSF